jgi:hypothetical protein
MRSSAADRGPAGRDDTYGAGVLDAEAALAAAGIPRVPAPQPAPGPTPPAAERPATRTSPGPPVRLTLAQMRASRRIALSAQRRLSALEARLSLRAAPHRLLSRPVGRVSVREIVITRRIARDTIARADRMERRLGIAPGRVDRPATAGPARLTVHGMRVTDRLARAALARVMRLHRASSAGAASPAAPRGSEIGAR